MPPPTTTSTNPEQHPPIRCTGPYKVSPTISLTPIWISDAAEQHRILNLNDSFYKGLYSDTMTFPFPKEEAIRFSTYMEQERVREGVCRTWAIRTSADSTSDNAGGDNSDDRGGGDVMIGLFSLEPQDHREMGPCYPGKELVLDATTAAVAAEAQGEAASRTTTTTTNNGTPLSCGGIGYWLSPEYAGKGIMTDVLKFALTQLAQEFGYQRVHGECWSDHIGSMRVMERARMQPVVGIPIFVPKFNTTKDVAHFIHDL